MAEYIEREELMKFPIRRNHYDKEHGKHGNEHFIYICGIETVLEYADNLPAADVAPVRHGRWYNRGGRFRCSVCDNKTLLKDIGGTGGWSHEYEQQKSPYCPNCGAKMDGGDENE